MGSKRNSTKRGTSGGSKPATVDECIGILKTVLLAHIGFRDEDKKTELGDDWKWEFWRLCRRIAIEPGNQLAGVLSSPARAVIPFIEDLMWKTEAGLRSENLSDKQREELEKFSEQLDFALALMYRNLGFLISWRAERTRSADLFCEAWGIAKGDAQRAGRLIRRCPEYFPGEVAVGPDNLVDSYAWEIYHQVAELDQLADEFPKQIATAAVQMHGWPMLRQRHNDNGARFEALAEQFKLGANYPLDTSKNARFRPDTPMVRYLDPLVYHLYYVREMTHSTHYESLEKEKESLRGWWRDGSEKMTSDAVVDVLRAVRRLPRLSKGTAAEWAKKAVVPMIVATDATDYRKCKEKALQRIAMQRGVKSVATFKSRLLAAVIPTLKSMARPA